MKKAAFLIAISSFLTTSIAYAAEEIKITPPDKGYNDLGNFITNIIQLSFALALLVVLVMLIWGAFEWISSGGDKETVGKARGRIINALIGLAVLSIAFALATVGAQFLGFPNLKTITIPGPGLGQSCSTTAPIVTCPKAFTCTVVAPATNPATFTCQ